VNLAGTWQSFTGAATPVGEARPAWKVLRVLGNLLGLTGFEQQTSEDVREELRSAAAPGALAAGSAPPAAAVTAKSLDTPMYQSDPVVRRSGPLQRTRVARGARGLA
jgi:NADH-quinone oxidoreductase subunit G